MVTTTWQTTVQSKVHSFLQASTDNPIQTTAAKICIEHLRNAEYRLNLTAYALPCHRIKDDRAWTSAELTYHNVCWSTLKNVNNTKMINEMMSLLDTLIDYISNALSMMMAYDVFGDKIASWIPPKTEREGLWEDGAVIGGIQLGIPAGLKANVMVCKGGGCKYEIVQEAVNAAPNWVHEFQSNFRVMIT